jgi:hypothetical protein
MRNSRSLLRFLLGLGCAFNNAAARPSTVTWADYNQLSTAFFQSVNNVLTGAESGKDAVLQVAQVANPSCATGAARSRQSYPFIFEVFLNLESECSVAIELHLMSQSLVGRSLTRKAFIGSMKEKLLIAFRSVILTNSEPWRPESPHPAAACDTIHLTI